MEDEPIWIDKGDKGYWAFVKECHTSKDKDESWIRLNLPDRTVDRLFKSIYDKEHNAYQYKLENKE